MAAPLPCSAPLIPNEPPMACADPFARARHNTGNADAELLSITFATSISKLQIKCAIELPFEVVK
jgi:hypothetical protein